MPPKKPLTLVERQKAEAKNQVIAQCNQLNAITTPAGISWTVADPTATNPTPTIRAKLSPEQILKIHTLFDQGAISGQMKLTNDKGQREWISFQDVFQKKRTWDATTDVMLETITNFTAIEMLFASANPLVQHVTEMHSALAGKLDASTAVISGKIQQSTDALQQGQRALGEQLTGIEKKVTGIDTKVDALTDSFSRVQSTIDAMRVESDAQRKNILQEVIKVQQQQDKQWNQMRLDRQEAIEAHAAVIHSFENLTAQLTTSEEKAKAYQQAANTKRDEILGLLKQHPKSDSSQPRAANPVETQIQKILDFVEQQEQRQKADLLFKKGVQQKLEKLDAQHQAILHEFQDTETYAASDDEGEINPEHHVTREKLSAQEQAVSAEHEIEMMELERQINHAPTLLTLEHEQLQLLQELKNVTIKSPTAEQFVSAVQVMFQQQTLSQQKQQESLDMLRATFQQHQEMSERREQTLLEKMDALLSTQQMQKEAMTAVDGFLQQMDVEQIQSGKMLISKKYFATSEANYFYDRLSTMMEEFHETMHSVNVGRSDPKQTKIHTVTESARIVSELIPIPYLQLAVNLLGKSVEKVDLIQKRKAAKKFDQYMDDDLSIIQQVAYQVTYRYQRQMTKLTELGIRQLVESAIKRMFDFIISQDKKSFVDFNDEQKIALLVQGVIEGDPNNIFNTPIETKNKKEDKEWRAEGLFKRSGLQVIETQKCYTKDNPAFSLKKSMDIKKYGFRLIHITELPQDCREVPLEELLAVTDKGHNLEITDTSKSSSSSSTSFAESAAQLGFLASQAPKPKANRVITVPDSISTAIFTPS